MARDTSTDDSETDIEVVCPASDCHRTVAASDLREHLHSLHYGDWAGADWVAWKTIRAAKRVRFDPDPVVPRDRRVLVTGLFVWVVSAVLGFNLDDAAVPLRTGDVGAAIDAVAVGGGLGSIALLVYVFVSLGLGWRVFFFWVDRATE